VAPPVIRGAVGLELSVVPREHLDYRRGVQLTLRRARCSETRVTWLGPGTIGDVAGISSHDVHGSARNLHLSSTELNANLVNHDPTRAVLLIGGGGDGF